MRMAEMFTDQVYLVRGSARRGPFRARVSSNQVILPHLGTTQVDIDEQDTVERELPNGRTEAYEIEEATFHSSPKPQKVPSNWELRVRKMGAKSSRRDAGTTINIENAGGVQVGDQNTQVIANSIQLLAQRIEQSGAPEAERASAKKKLAEFLAHPLVASLLGAAAGSAMGRG